MSAYNDAQRNNQSTRNAQQYKDLDLFFSIVHACSQIHPTK